MKRLIDEAPDELTRSLLQAGIDHRPPPGNQGRVLVALGAGASVGLLSSKAFAWWGTTAGKLTAVGLSVGVAGAVYTGVVNTRPQIATGALQASVAETPAQPAPDPRALPAQPAPAISTPAAPPAAAFAPIVTSTKNTAEEKPARARPRRALAPIEPVKPENDEVAKPSPVAANDPEPAAQLGLDTEVQWVDAMRTAARRGDRDHLAKLIERYRVAFPEGQLRREVADLATRL